MDTNDFDEFDDFEPTKDRSLLYVFVGTAGGFVAVGTLLFVFLVLIRPSPETPTPAAPPSPVVADVDPGGDDGHEAAGGTEEAEVPEALPWEAVGDDGSDLPLQLDGILDPTSGRVRLRARLAGHEGHDGEPLARVTLKATYFKGHRTSAMVSQAPAGGREALFDVNLDPPGKYHLLLEVVTSDGDESSFTCDLCVGDDAALCLNLLPCRAAKKEGHHH
jgi:hypothetical protein